MSAPRITEPQIKGWCPGALRPMESGDGFLVRIRAPLGRLTPAQARGIADLARRFGSARLDLSARANLQMRGIAEHNLPHVQSGLNTLGLLDPDPETEARRNLVVAPFWSNGDATHEIATALQDALVRRTGLHLPGKFGFAVDCGPTPVLQDVSADIRLETGADGTIICRADGTDAGLPVTPDTAVKTALDLAEWFVASGGVTENRGRMARHLKSGAVLPKEYTRHPMLAAKPHFLPKSGVLVGFEFGQLTADLLDHLAGIGAIRLTPWRMVLIEGATQNTALDPMMLRPDDPRLRISACPGAPDCAQGLSAVRPLARLLGASLPDTATLHVSGCSKGCAHPGPSTTTLVGEGAGKFALIHDGRASDRPLQTKLGEEQILANPDDIFKGS